MRVATSFSGYLVADPSVSVSRICGGLRISSAYLTVSLTADQLVIERAALPSYILRGSISKLAEPLGFALLPLSDGAIAEPGAVVAVSPARMAQMKEAEATVSKEDIDDTPKEEDTDSGHDDPGF